ncbi:SDR family NAD(P)-dependent oxidoreductase [Pseudoduganella namucuonensis]|uniref:Meso-butanediol dehydrogenase / (S,S)-butanediol dehydrogenase / diacetyl reductase n=1 Tax=Pseudoduganella namucuonensis TaxID=1035707 RepID=A0A1I7LS60_9BURK|nr:SDR family NAD(P)-dependent oxidoreductase [Pseudoduganella namucuonensis]SFV12524.1 meso-butanediol dehydrogenase / (S,S)-butanediol dehydrogenase / diacetyl reductase [Pseudoduganella namucuonensis]
MRFKGKIALVTGAASGIGRASAVRLAREGATLALADINTAAIEEVAAELRRAHDTTVACFVFDATNTDSCRGMVSAAAAHFGAIDVLCNIAGIAGGWHFHEMPQAAWDRMVAINLTSVFAISQEAIPHLVRSRGNIVNMASASAKQGQPYTTAYCATKAGVVALTRCLAVEYAKDGVRANAICPGGVNTPINQTLNFPTDIDAKMMDKLYPLFPMAEPEEIAAAVAYLASDEARYVTGIDFSIDGGQTMS